LPLEGRHHCGLDDCRNIARLLAALLRSGAEVREDMLSVKAKAANFWVGGEKGVRAKPLSAAGDVQILVGAWSFHAARVWSLREAPCSTDWAGRRSSTSSVDGLANRPSQVSVWYRWHDMEG